MIHDDTPAHPLRQRLIALLSAGLMLAGCGGAPQQPMATAPQPPATLQTGDTTIRASAVSSLALGDAAARQYGIDRDPRTVLLLVGVRRGPESQETSLPARIGGSATDLLGRRQPLVFREVRSGGYVDYVSTIRIAPPETLRFDLTIERDGAVPAALSFNRDFFAGP